MSEKSWFFPKNVDNKYKVFFNMTLLELIKFLVPAVVLSLLIASIPPYSSVILWIVKLIFIAIILSIDLFYVLYRPIPERDNIRTKDFIESFIKFKDSQKIYFVRPKNRLGNV